MPKATQDSVRRTVCCGCAQQCGVLVHVGEGGSINRITGDREHPTSAGFICQKGSTAHALHYDASRLHRPLKRQGSRGSGEWQEIEWEQALDEIAATIERLVDRHGRETLAHSFGTLHGADWGIGERFMNLFGSPNTVGQDKVCYGPNALAEAITYGFGPTFYTYPAIGTTRCIVIWGMRPSASMPLLWRAVLRARRAGSQLIVIDPERTREAMTADIWLQNRPGTDTALALGMIDCIISENLHDSRFVTAETIGFDELKQRAACYHPEHVADLTGVKASDIRRAARTLATNGPALIHGGNGLCQSGSMAVQSGRALSCLIAITGNIGTDGGHKLAGPPRDIVANGDAVAVDALSPDQRTKRLGAEEFPHIGSGYGDLDEAMSRAWYGKRHILSWLATAHEPSLWDAIVEEKPYPVKALILQCHNALGSAANAKTVVEALTSEKLELLVAHDLFVNATTRLADYVLPACHWLERPFFSVAYGYMGFAGDYVEAALAPIPAEHEHRSDYELWRDLGRRLGQPDEWPETAEDFWDGLVRPAGLNFETLCETLGPRVGTAATLVAPESQQNDAFGTPSGKVELRSSLLEQWGRDPLPFFELPALFRDHAEQYPLVLTTGGRLIEGFHQNSQQMPGFRRKHKDPVVRLHSATAAAAGVEDGEWIEIQTPVGEVRQVLRVTEDLAPGVVHADRWWYPERGNERDDPFGFWSTNINVCTENAADSCDPIMGSWLLRGLPCRVAPAITPAVEEGLQRSEHADSR